MKEEYLKMILAKADYILFLEWIKIKGKTYSLDEEGRVFNMSDVRHFFEIKHQINMKVLKSRLDKLKKI